jgi:hypothetical protein
MLDTSMLGHFSKIEVIALQPAKQFDRIEKNGRA